VVAKVVGDLLFAFASVSCFSAAGLLVERVSGTIAMIFLDLIVPRSVIAVFSGRYPKIAGRIDNISRVESLANPASTLTRLVLIGIFFSQSKKISGEKSLALTSSETRMLNKSLGYSGRSDSEVVEEADAL